MGELAAGLAESAMRQNRKGRVDLCQKESHTHANTIGNLDKYVFNSNKYIFQFGQIYMGELAAGLAESAMRQKRKRKVDFCQKELCTHAMQTS